MNIMTAKRTIRYLMMTARRCPWFSVLMVASALVGVGVTRYCARVEPFPRSTTVHPMKRYEPGIAYEILNAPQWELTGRTVSGVPVVEPADKRTQELAERVLGKEAAKTAEFLFVGELGEAPDGGDVYVVSEAGDDGTTIPVPTNGRSVDIGELPNGVPRKPTRLIFVARPAPRFDWRDPHRFEFEYGFRFEDKFEQEWRLTYRPYEWWLWGRTYLYAEGGIYQQRGDVVDTGVDLFLRGGAGLCINREEC